MGWLLLGIADVHDIDGPFLLCCNTLMKLISHILIPPYTRLLLPSKTYRTPDAAQIELEKADAAKLLDEERAII